jgi:DNA-binding transcriptional LysR family regulator
MSDSLEFRLLKYILAVAETLNFTRAAQRLFLAQPSLSKQIRDLEIDIKFPLFERSRDGIRITDAGRIVIAYGIQQSSGCGCSSLRLVAQRRQQM